jgi:3-hydroxyisobutyrate dehydrogenase-like beta-hydroxyacid dehydrogenase
MMEGRYPTAFPLKHQQKDLRLALEAAGEGSLTLPVAAAANDLYKEVGASSPLSPSLSVSSQDCHMAVGVWLQ